MLNNLPSTKILGTNITTAKKEVILEYIFKCIEKRTEKFYIVTPNPEILVYATRSSSFQKVLNGARVSLPDGVGVLLAGKMQKKGIPTRITGVDMMELMCQEASKKAVTVGFLGGRDGVAEMTAECLTKKYPQLRVNFVGEEWNGRQGVLSSLPSRSTSSSSTAGAHRDSHSARHPSKSSHLQPNHIDILFVAFGFPKQEEWMAKNIADLPVTVAMGVGGAFDYFSGRVPRAPKFVRSTGMEWAFRLVRQPWRIKRQLALPVFAYKIVKESLGKI